MNDFYVIEIQENFNSMMNEKEYKKGSNFIAWKDNNGYRIANCNMDFIPNSIVKLIYKIEFNKIV